MESPSDAEYQLPTAEIVMFDMADSSVTCAESTYNTGTGSGTITIVDDNKSDDGDDDYDIL